MYARIMVGIDDSFAAGNVLTSAIELALKFQAKLALCHALDDTPLAQQFARVALPDGVASVEASLRATAMEFLERAAAQARQAGLEVEIQVVESERDNAAELLARAATAWQADLLVVGAHAHGSMTRLFASGVGEKLVGIAPSALLLVRNS